MRKLLSLLVSVTIFLAPLMAAASFDSSAVMNAKVVSVKPFQCEKAVAFMFLTEVDGKNYVTIVNQEGKEKRAIVLEYSDAGEFTQAAFGSVESDEGGKLSLVRGEFLSADEAATRYGNPCAFLESSSS